VIFPAMETGSNSKRFLCDFSPFVNKTIKNWNQLPAEALWTFPCKSKIFRNRIRKETINGVKLKVKKCGENHLKVR
jgi:hypothetical protein